MPSDIPQEEDKRCESELGLAREFPDLYDFYSGHPARWPRDAEIWERVLRVARASRPILEDLRTRGFDLVFIEQSTDAGIDRRPLHETLLAWLPRVDDPVTLWICLGRLEEAKARPLLRKHRKMLFAVARVWMLRQPMKDRHLILASLMHVITTVAKDADLPEVLGWVRNAEIPLYSRTMCLDGLRRFARRPGPFRDVLVSLLEDGELGDAAVWVLARAAKEDALPLLREVRESSNHAAVREAASAAVQKMESRILRVNLPAADPATLPQDYGLTHVELDTSKIGLLLRAIERELGGHLEADTIEALPLSAAQLRSGKHRFHIVPLTYADGKSLPVGFGFVSEDEDVRMIQIHFKATLLEAIEAAIREVAY